MLHRNILRPEADALFEVLCRAPEMKGFTLIGGTALALQLGHRLSLDFDFAQFGGVPVICEAQRNKLSMLIHLLDAYATLLVRISNAHRGTGD